MIQQLFRAYNSEKAIFYTGIEFQGEGITEPAQTFSRALATVCSFVCRHVDIDWERKIARPKGIPQIDLFGWSWGATIANTLAAHLKLRGCDCHFGRRVTHGLCWLFWWTSTEWGSFRWRPAEIRFMGLIDPVSTRLDAVEATIIPNNLKYTAIAYAETYDTVG